MRDQLDRINKEFVAAYKQFKFWAALAIVLVICSFAVIVYESTLSTGPGWPAISMIICSNLVTIPVWRARCKMKRSYQDLGQFVKDKHDEYYKTVTGEDR